MRKCLLRLWSCYWAESRITSSSPGASARPYTLNTAQPAMKVIEDESVTIGDAGLANSVVVQRYT